MDILPTEVVDLIYKFVHNLHIKDLNKQFKNFVLNAKFYYTMQVYRDSFSFNYTRHIQNYLHNLEFTEICFRRPSSVKYFNI